MSFDQLSRAPTYLADDDLIEATRQDGLPRLRVTRPSRTMVVLGRGSRADRELNLAACERDSIPMLRRRGGGCAVVLDPGNVVVSLTLTARGIGNNQARFDSISRWLIDGLARVGFSGVEQEGISDLCVADRKVAGACLYRSKDLLLYSATLLVSADLDLLERYLAHPPREPEYRRGRSHGHFVTNLRESADARQVAAQLSRQLRLDELKQPIRDWRAA